MLPLNFLSIDSVSHLRRIFALSSVWCVLAFAPSIHAESSPQPLFQIKETTLPAQGMWKSTPAAADINKDGHLDLAAIPRAGKGAAVWLGSSTGEWKESSHGLELVTSCGGTTRFADVNRDGHPDLVVADACQGIFVYLGDGQGNWRNVVSNLAPGIAKRKPAEDEGASPSDADLDPFDERYLGSQSLALGDINGDGHLDIVAVASKEGGFTVYFGDGTGLNWKEVDEHGLPTYGKPEPESFHSRGGWGNSLDLVDIDGDGHLDVVAAYCTGPRVWRGNGKGTFLEASTGLPTPTLSGLYMDIAFGDVNGDGLVDLVAANYVNGVEVFLAKPDKTWESARDAFPRMQGGAQAVGVADLNGDGHLDILAGGILEPSYGAVYGLFLLYGDGKGNWAEAENSGFPPIGLSVVWGMMFDDINGNGLTDVFVTTGGVNPSPPPNQLLALRTKVDFYPELEIPRLQIWLNQHKK